MGYPPDHATVADLRAEVAEMQERITRAHHVLFQAITAADAAFEGDSDRQAIAERLLNAANAALSTLDRIADGPTRTCAHPGDQEHDHEMCRDVVEAEREQTADRSATVRADQLAEGQTIVVPYIGESETITAPPRITGDYVNVQTIQTGRFAAYQWLRGEPITVLPCDDACERERTAAETCRHTD